MSINMGNLDQQINLQKLLIKIRNNKRKINKLIQIKINIITKINILRLISIIISILYHK